MRASDRERPWDQTEIQKLHVWWTEDRSAPWIGRQLNRSGGSIVGKIRRLRHVQGVTLWPNRPSPIKPRSRAGGHRIPITTLPPLPSLG